MQFKRNILCLDNNNDNCELVGFVFEQLGYKVISVSDAQSALKLAQECDFAAFILDYRLTNSSGVEVCRALRKFNQTIQIIFFTGSAFPSEKSAGLAAGADAYLIKPNDFGRLTETVLKLISPSKQLMKRRDAFYFSAAFALSQQIDRNAFAQAA